MLEITVTYQTFSDICLNNLLVLIRQNVQQKIDLELHKYFKNHSSLNLLSKVKESSVLNTVQYLDMLILTGFDFKRSGRMLQFT